MRYSIVVFLLLAQLITAQNSEKKIWDLLLANKRTEACKLFDKDLKSQTDKNIDCFLLDKIIELESGQIDFDESFVQNFSKFPESKNYICSIFKSPILINDIKSIGYNDQTYKKTDDLASLPIYKDDPMVIYNKAIADRNRKDFLGYSNNIKLLNSINDWQFCGVFENLNDSGIEIEYEPEIYPKNDKTFDANSNGKVNWYNPTVLQNEGYHAFLNESEYGNGIMYSQVFVDNPIERDVILNFGMGASMKIFINDIEVYVNTLNKLSDLNAFKLKITLPKGMNRILLKSSIGGGNNYFFLALKDTKNNKIDDLTYYNSYKEYTKSTLNALNVQELIPEFESFLINKIKEYPNQELYKILLYDAYIHNKKLELAHNIIDDLDNRYPNSSMIKIRLANYYDIKEDDAKVKEINKNLEAQDKDYYYNFLIKAQDSEWLKSVNIMELEKLRDRAKKLPSSVLGYLFDFLINARNSKISEMLANVDQILKESHNNEFYITTFAPLYDSLDKNKEKTIKMLEDLVKKTENYSAMSQLIGYYRDADRKEDEKKIFLDRKNNYPYFIGEAKAYISLLITEKKYDEALIEIDKALGLFPYSYIY